VQLTLVHLFCQPPSSPTQSRGDLSTNQPKESVFLRQPLDQPQVQFTLGTPTSDAFWNRWTEPLVKTKSPVSQFLGRDCAQIVSELPFQVPSNAFWLDPGW